MMFQTTYLSFQLPNGVSQEIELERDKPITVGRNRASTIKLNLPSVSRQHANLFFEGGSFWVEDLGSSNGTYVNKEQIHRARVTSGDVIRCGEFSISVLSRGDTRVHSSKDKPVPSRSIQPRSNQPRSTQSRAGLSQPTPSFNFSTDQQSQNVSSHSMDVALIKPTTEFSLSSSSPQKSSRPASSKSPPQKWHSKAPTSHPNNADHDPLRSEVMNLKISESQLLEKINQYEMKVMNQRAQLEAQIALTEQLKQELHKRDVVHQKIQERLDQSEAELHLKIIDGENHSQIRDKELTEIKEQNSRLRQQLRAQQQQKEDEVLSLQQDFKKLELEREQLLRQVRNNLSSQEQALLTKQCKQLQINLEEQNRINHEYVEREHKLKQEVELQSQEINILLSQKQENVDLISDLNQRLENVEKESSVLESKLIRQKISYEEASSHYALPRPNQIATDPNWAQQQARLEQYLHEVRTLRRINYDLKSKIENQNQLSEHSASSSELVKSLRIQLNQNTHLKDHKHHLARYHDALDLIESVLNNPSPKSVQTSSKKSSATRDSAVENSSTRDSKRISSKTSLDQPSVKTVKAEPKTREWRGII